MITFEKVLDGMYITSDLLYTIVKGYDTWIVRCKTESIAYTLTLKEAKEVVKAIRIIHFHDIDMSKTL